MDLKIISQPLILDIHGFSGTAVGKDYAGTAFRLMDKMWETVKANKLKNNGLNIWVYGQYDSVFAGVQLDELPERETGLERKEFILKKYAYYKHAGPYNLIKKTAHEMSAELERNGFTITLPYIEIYGHWTADESRLETELIMSLE